MQWTNNVEKGIFSDFESSISFQISNFFFSAIYRACVHTQQYRDQPEINPPAPSHIHHRKPSHTERSVTNAQKKAF